MDNVGKCAVTAYVGDSYRFIPKPTVDSVFRRFLNCGKLRRNLYTVLSGEMGKNMTLSDSSKYGFVPNPPPIYGGHDFQVV